MLQSCCNFYSTVCINTLIWQGWESIPGLKKACPILMESILPYVCVFAATASLAIHRQEMDEIVNTALSDTLVLTGEEEFVRFDSWTNDASSCWPAWRDHLVVYSCTCAQLKMQHKRQGYTRISNLISVLSYFTFSNVAINWYQRHHIGYLCCFTHVHIDVAKSSCCAYISRSNNRRSAMTVCGHTYGQIELDSFGHNTDTMFANGCIDTM